MQEITWKDIPNFTRYQASTNGLIRSKNYCNQGIVKTLKPAPNKQGYLKTMLKSDSGKYRTIYVHKMVAYTYLGEVPKKGYEVNHKDGNKQNNSPSNLEYLSKKENIRHAWKNHLVGTRNGSNNAQSILTENDVLDIRQTAKDRGLRYNNKELAEKYGVSRDLIQRVVNRRAWTHI